MKFSVATILAAASAVSASTGLVGNITYTTEVVTAYTTYCPEATTLTYGAQTYTISQATTLTITDCPCTISKPVYTSSTPKPSNNETVPTTTGPSGRVPTGTYTPTPSIMTAGAAKAMVASGAGLAGVMAVALAL